MVTLDAGPLIAADRNDRRFWVWWKWVTRNGIVVRVPAPVVAQAWRGARNARMAQVLAGCDVIHMDGPAARRTGELCARAGTSDIVDAFVIESAASRGDDVLTTDPADLERLAAHRPGVGRIRVL